MLSACLGCVRLQATLRLPFLPLWCWLRHPGYRSRDAGGGCVVPGRSHFCERVGFLVACVPVLTSLPGCVAGRPQLLLDSGEGHALLGQCVRVLVSAWLWS